MNAIAIREMTPDETPLLVKWLYEHRQTNQVDLEPFRRNQVRIYVASDKTGILAFIPIQCVYRFGALAPQPGIAPFRLAKVCEEMTNFIQEKAKEENVSEVWVQPSDAQFSEFLQNLGYGATSDILYMNFNQKAESK